MVRTLPERIKAMMRKVANRISAMPKSGIKASRPMQAPVKIKNSPMFFLVCKRSKVEVPTKIKAIFTNSEGCTLRGPMRIQLVEP